MRYRGIITDQLTGDKKMTRYYPSYYEAHQAAERLAKRYIYDRWSIDVDTSL